MIVVLEEPFKSSYCKGYLSTHENDGRQYISLYGPGGKSKTMTYARYLYGVKIGYEVPEDIEIDHWDGDKTNDDINNLKPMTHAMHVAKTYAFDRVQEEVVDLICPECQQRFTRTARYIRDKKSQRQKEFYCGSRCNRMNNPQADRTIPIDTVTEIKRLRAEKKSSYTISRELGIARNTVMRHW